jgi:UDP-N-acetylmuramoyl-tripeptide--D-alanyl-D-alanine ligase
MSVQKVYDQFLKSNGVSIDTRSLSPGQIFIGLRGDRFDGNTYVKKALEMGALLAVSDRFELASEDKVYYVKNSLIFLQELAAYHRSKLKYPIIALTGSNGKTTTKELIYAVLTTKYKVGVTKGNYNNHIGVPLTVLSFDDDLEIGIVEMGANHIGEIELLCSIARPDYGVITNIGQAHIGEFGSFEAIKKGKGELYEAIKKSNGTIFINRSSDYLSDILGSYEKVVSFNDESMPYDGEYLEIEKVAHPIFASLKLSRDREAYQIETELVGGYNYRNILIAIAIAGHFGVALKDSVRVLNGFSLDMNRSQLKVIDGVEYIMDAYNANPSSMLAALEDFNNSRVNVKALILGEMMELGEHTSMYHENILKEISAHAYECVILIGESYMKFKDQYDFRFFRTVEEARMFWSQQDKSGWRTLIKGSRSVGLERIIDPD